MVITGRAMGPTRCVRNRLAEQILNAGKSVTSVELLNLIGIGRSTCAAVEGGAKRGTIYCGQIAGLIAEVKSAKEVIREILEGAQALRNNLKKTGQE